MPKMTDMQRYRCASIVTQQDMRDSKREAKRGPVNYGRLPLLLAAVQRASEHPDAEAGILEEFNDTRMRDKMLAMIRNAT